jgi:hypothetical protein
MLCLVFIGAAHAQEFTYTTNNGSITITRYKGAGGPVNIPGTITGLPVTAIGDWAFYSTSPTSVAIPGSITSIGDYAFDSCFSLTSVTIPDSVTNLGIYAFPWCYSLTNVTIGNNVPAIGYWAFYECSSLTRVTIPDSVTSIGDNAFQANGLLTNIFIGKNVTNIASQAFDYCSSLTSILVDAVNPVYSSVDGVLFDKSQRTLIQCPPGKTGNYAIPEGVTNIGPDAFSSCWNPTNITIPESITRIGPYALSGFVGLTRIAIPASVTSIGTNALAGCLHLTTTIIGRGVTNIEDEAFAYCTNFSFALYFEGNAPVAGNDLFDSDGVVPVYYLPDTTGWGSTFGGQPTVLWNPLARTDDASFGVRQNQFGFNVTGTANIPIVIEASPKVSTGSWVALQSGRLTNGLIYFSDPQWTNYLTRIYRIRSP